MPRSGRPVRGWRAQGARIFVYASLTIAGLVVLIPFLFALSGSMKTAEDVFTYPPRILPYVAATATVNGEELPVFTVPLPEAGRRTSRGSRTARAFASSARLTIRPSCSSARRMPSSRPGPPSRWTARRRTSTS